MPPAPVGAVDLEIERRLRAEPVVWVTSVRPDGRPHVVPTWFWWDGSAFLIFSKPHAVKVANLAAHPSVMLALGDPMADFDVLLVEGEASLVRERTAEILPPALLAKYRGWLDAIGLGPAEYAATYSQPIRIAPRRFLPWHGRTPRGSVPSTGAVASAPLRRRDGRPSRRAAPIGGRPARRSPLAHSAPRPARASSSVHPRWRPTADGAGARPRDAAGVKRRSEEP